MCGLIGGQIPTSLVEATLPALAHRGPDHAAVWTDGTWTLGHTRLGVQAPGDTRADQPHTHARTTLTYNGEHWNPDMLPGPGDTPGITRLLDQDGPAALPTIDGMFALAWVTDGTLHLARDTFGEIPLHYAHTPGGALVWASEIAPLLALGAAPATVRWFPPGHVLAAPPDGPATLTRWTDLPGLTPSPDDHEQAVSKIRSLFAEAVESRMTSDVPVAVLLSGGLDSSAILTHLVGSGYEVHPYLAVHHPTAADVKHARTIAHHFGLPLTEVTIPAPTRETLAGAVAACEMPHKAQVEITLACLPLAARIAADGFRVVLSGEGSDELWASYGMAYHGIQKHGWGPYRRDLYTGQHRKNFARVNKTFMAHSVEARMPFLHPPLARYALTLTQQAVTHGRHPKAVLAAAVSPPLPAASAWRTKRAFQTDARLDQAAANTVAAPARFYRAEYQTRFRGVTP